MKKYLLFLFIIISATVQGQKVITGKVIDEKTKEALPGVSIYINNSTIGTVTNSMGEFILNTPFNGKVELIASYIGYFKQTLIVDNTTREGLSVSLKVQPNTLNEVVIKSTKNKNDNYEIWGQLFRMLLLGKGSHDFVSKIKNPEVLVFYYDQDLNKLSVFTKSPLIVENTTTNYIVKLDFDSFEYSFSTQELQTVFTSFFEEAKFSEAIASQIDNARQLAYYGSQMHFLRMAYKNDLTRNGFKLYLFKSTKNPEKERISKLIQQVLKEDPGTQSAVMYDIAKLFKNKDTVNYYKLVMKQDDVMAADTTYTSLRKFAKYDRTQDFTHFYASDTLMVSYQSAIDRNNKRTLPENLALRKVINPHGKERTKTTILYFSNAAGVSLQSTGYYPETNLFFYGEMFERRIAQLLPWDYTPDQKL